MTAIDTVIKAIELGAEPAMALIKFIANRPTSKDEALKILRALKTDPPRRVSIDAAALAAIKAGNAVSDTLPPPPLDRATVDLADRLIEERFADLSTKEGLDLSDAIGVRFREKVARELMQNDLGE